MSKGTELQPNMLLHYGDVHALEELDTPCLIIDGELVQHNVKRMAAYCVRHGLSLRPHTKTHKSLRIAKLQLDAGAVGVTVAKPGEARVMAQLGADVLIAYPSVTRGCLNAIVELLPRCNVFVVVDSVEAIDRLDAAIPTGGPKANVLADIDIGLHRTGVASPEESVRLAQRINNSNRLRLDGLFCYPGHIWEKPSEQNASLAKASEAVFSHLEAWRVAGLRANTVSGGSTPTAFQSHLMRGVTEIRPGTYVFNDMNTVHGGYCSLADCAVRILATVISDAVPGQIVIDAGSKALAKDPCIPLPTAGYGHVVEFPEAKIAHLSEEHGQVDVSCCANRPRVGDRVSVIPNHVCPVINLTDEAWWLSQRNIEKLTIDTRGMVR